MRLEPRGHIYKRHGTGTKPGALDDFFESPTYLDSREFKLYAADVERIIEGSGTRGVTTREIHRRLGHRLQHMTLDAIESIKGVIEIGVLPTRYRKIAGGTRRRPKGKFRFDASFSNHCAKGKKPARVAEART